MNLFFSPPSNHRFWHSLEHLTFLQAQLLDTSANFAKALPYILSLPSHILPFAALFVSVIHLGTEYHIALTQKHHVLDFSFLQETFEGIVHI